MFKSFLILSFHNTTFIAKEQRVSYCYLCKWCMFPPQTDIVLPRRSLNREISVPTNNIWEIRSVIRRDHATGPSPIASIFHRKFNLNATWSQLEPHSQPSRWNSLHAVNRGKSFTLVKQKIGLQFNAIGLQVLCRPSVFFFFFKSFRSILRRFNDRVF